MDVFRHAQIVILDHSFVIGHTSSCGISIVSNLLTPHATMKFYIILVYCMGGNFCGVLIFVEFVGPT